MPHKFNYGLMKDSNRTLLIIFSISPNLKYSVCPICFIAEK